MKLPYAALAACCSIAAGSLYAQAPAPTPPALSGSGSPTASILFPDGRILPIRSSGGNFPLVFSSGGEAITIQCRIPAALASRLVIQSLDGGILDGPSPVAADGTTQLQYVPATQPGLYRIWVGLGGYSAILQFWVPEANGDNTVALVPQGGVR